MAVLKKQLCFGEHDRLPVNPAQTRVCYDMDCLLSVSPGEKLYIFYVKLTPFSTIFHFLELKTLAVIFLGHILGKVNRALEQS